MLAGRGEADDPRASRAAAIARRAGYEVTYICPRKRTAAGGRLYRVGRSSALLRELRGLARLARLVGTTQRLVRAARRTGRFAVVHAHDFETLPTGALLRRRGARLVYDAHELYADEEPDPPRSYRSVVRLLEPLCARRADAVVTVGDELARELRQRLRRADDPVVVLSCPFVQHVEPQARPGRRLRALYQGATGPGRPLGDLLDAIASADGVQLTIRVANADLRELRQAVAARGLEEAVEVAAPVPPDRVVAAAADFHVGLVINRPVTRNDELVLPNKLFEYLMAGLAVVAPRLPALRRVVEDEEVGLTYEPGDPQALGEALAALAQDRAGLAEMRRRARRLALERYNAEAQAQALEQIWRDS